MTERFSEHILDTEEVSITFQNEIPSSMFMLAGSIQSIATDVKSNRILIVDDEPFNLLGLESVLQLAAK